MSDNEYKRFRAVTHRARKQHRCSLCNGTIESGDMYEYWTGIWDYSFAIMKTCKKCLGDREPRTDVQKELGT